MKKLICLKLTKVSNGHDIALRQDIHLAITDEHGNIEVELGVVFPSWLYPKNLEAGDELKIIVAETK